MTCEEALKRLYEIIDKEASDTDRKEVEEHLENCKHCMARYEFEAMFKNFVADKASSVPRHGEILKARILQRIDDAGKSPGGFLSNPFRYKTVIFSAAAALVICILAAFAASKFYRHKVYTYPFEQHHMALADYAADEADDFSDSPEIGHFVANDMHLVPATDDIGGFRMASAGFDELQGQKFAHIRYIRDDVRVSLFIGKAEGVNLPDFERAVSAGVEYFKHICAECQVIYWNEGETLAVVVTEDKAADLTVFIPAFNAI